MLDIIKTSFATFLGGIIAYMTPLHNAMFVINLIFVIDLVLGFVSGIVVNDEKFSIKKFGVAALIFSVYLFIVACIYTIGERMGDADESLFVVKTVTYVFVYFYGANIFRNLTRLFPDNRIFAFLYFVFGLEFTKRIPWLGEFLTKDKENETNG